MSALSATIRAGEFRTSYTVAFEAYLDEPDERRLHAAYELGREAVARDLALIDVAAMHHEVLAAAVEADHERTRDVVIAAGDFLVETLSAFEMIQRGYREARERALVEQRHAAMLRQLSSLLSDASIAAGAADSLEEVLQLVAEQARELTGATSCVARARGRYRLVDAIAQDEAFDPRAAGVRLSVPVMSLRGWQIGVLEIAKRDGRFGELEHAVLVHLAQMTAATIERAGLHGR